MADLTSGGASSTAAEPGSVGDDPVRLPAGEVSATIIAHNEGHRIAQCLESVRWCREIVVVVDTATTDDTVEVARRYTDRVFLRPFLGFSDQRQWADEQATSDWILSIDCDEQVPPELAEEIRTELRAPRHVAYQVPHLDYMFGKWIRFGGQFPQYHVRLYRKDAARWTSPIHEKVEIQGGLGRIGRPILHFSHLRVDDFVKKLSRYTTVDAQAMYDRGERSSWFRVLVEPPLYFGYKYVVQRGFRDGMHGLVLSLLHMTYRLVRNLKLWDVQQSAAGPLQAQDAPPPVVGPRR